jgi:glycosyltransferase involved in cell wall biosynthesis
MDHDRTLLVLGTRGVPASHGGFETFAEKLAFFLVARGWRVIVYCQQDVERLTSRVTREQWMGIERRIVGVTSRGPRATLEFDWFCVCDAARERGVCLVLGYNGAMFLPYLKLFGRKVVTNMDGIEWRRPKWSRPARIWFWVNEWIAAWVSDQLIADHPMIAAHVATRRNRGPISMIPYGGPDARDAPVTPLERFGLEPNGYLIVVARIEPDNNILTLVEAFSSARRGIKLVVVGALGETPPYHRRIRAAASDEVIFVGAIYDRTILESLRRHARAYLHGHTVGGTNPSLVEALWAGNAVIAHDNPYNRWTAGDAGAFFADAEECRRLIDRAASDDASLGPARRAAVARAASVFSWDAILAEYERVALGLLGARTPAPAAVAPLAEAPLAEAPLALAPVAAAAAAAAPREAGREPIPAISMHEPAFPGAVFPGAAE